VLLVRLFGIAGSRTQNCTNAHDLFVHFLTVGVLVAFELVGTIAVFVDKFHLSVFSRDKGNSVHVFARPDYQVERTSCDVYRKACGFVNRTYIIQTLDWTLSSRKVTRELGCAVFVKCLLLYRPISVSHVYYVCAVCSEHFLGCPTKQSKTIGPIANKIIVLKNSNLTYQNSYYI
jgi:hypothetical protein